MGFNSIFGRERNMQWSSEVTALYLDGTFKQAPPLFCQVYAVLAERNGYVFPLLYALLPNKLRHTNMNLFTSFVRNHGTEMASSAATVCCAGFRNRNFSGGASGFSERSALRPITVHDELLLRSDVYRPIWSKLVICNLCLCVRFFRQIH